MSIPPTPPAPPGPPPDGAEFPASDAPTIPSPLTTTPGGSPGQTRRARWRDRLRHLWRRGWAYKVGMIAVIPFLCICVCCSSSIVFSLTPYGQQLARETEATETTQAFLSAQQAASATAYARAHPKPTATPTATATPIPTDTPQPTSTSTATPSPLPQPTQTPTPPPPPPTATPCPGVNCNPWGYNFSCCNYIYNPPSNICDYFACIPSFWDHTNGYVEECQDGDYSHSGGVSGSCSSHGGNWRPLLQR